MRSWHIVSRYIEEAHHKHPSFGGSCKPSKWMVVHLPVCCLIAVVLAGNVSGTAQAAPTFEVASSTTQARKGQPFHVYLTIATQEDVSQLRVSWSPPTAFAIEQINKPIPDALPGGSSFIADFLVQPPGSWHVNDPGGDTREEKKLVFNVAYVTQVSGQARSGYQPVTLTFRYSLNPVLYVINGMLGLLFGSVIKTVTAHKQMLATQQASTARGDGGLVLKLLRGELTTMLTGVAIGFVVLLVLARTEIPAKGWADSFALGVTLAILTDDQLLTKLKGS
jgi:hypothetical protein